MDLKEKIKVIRSKNGLHDNKELSTILGIHPTLFNRNVREQRLTGDMLIAFANTPKLNVDLNWLARTEDNQEFSEPATVYGQSAEEKLEKAIDLLHQVKEEVSRK